MSETADEVNENKIKIAIGQIYWDWNGHVSHCDSRSVYIVLGMDKDQFWQCASIRYHGSNPMFMGGGDNCRFLEHELKGMRFIGMIPYNIMEESIGVFREYELDRKWLKHEKKRVNP